MNSNSGDDKSVSFLYGSAFGRVLMRLMLACKVPALLGAILRSPISCVYIKPFIKKNNIDMSGFEGIKFRSFNDFFTRKKEIQFDAEPTHLISPCDGMLSVYQISDESVFHIKGFDYTVADLLGGSDAAVDFNGGMCLVFRLRPIDYHRYSYIDNGTLEENHFIQGTLHSVQSAACSKFRVYTKNRRSWTILHTEHFGNVAQIEVGAFSVGGIVNHHQNAAFKKGEEKGYFDLHGSTIVMLFQKGAAELLPEVVQGCEGGTEYGVRVGMAIGLASEKTCPKMTQVSR